MHSAKTKALLLHVDHDRVSHLWDVRDAAGGDDNGIDVYSDYDDDDEEALLG